MTNIPHEASYVGFIAGRIILSGLSSVALRPISRAAPDQSQPAKQKEKKEEKKRNRTVVFQSARVFCV